MSSGEKFASITDKINDPSLSANKLEELFYRGLGLTIFVVGVVPSLLFFLIAPVIDQELRGIDSDVKIPPKEK